MVPFPLPALAVTLARVASYKELRVREFFELLDVTFDNHGWFDVIPIDFTGKVPNIVCPDNLEPSPLQCKVAAAAATEQ